MKIHFPTPFVAIIGMMASPLSTHQAWAQTEADAVRPELPGPTVPETGTGGPKAIQIDPEKVQPDAAGKMETIPGADLAIPEIVGGAIDFTTFAGALRASGLNDRLKADGPFTLLAPDNDAFAALPEGVFAMLMKPENVELLRKILTYHIIPKKVTTTELVPGSQASSQGEALTIVGGTEGELTIQGASFGITDVMAKNGVIHSVKAVLIPPTISIEDLTPADTEESATGDATDAAAEPADETAEAEE